MDSLRVIARNSLSFGVERTEIVLSFRVALFGRLPKPDSGLLRVAFDTEAHLV